MTLQFLQERAQAHNCPTEQAFICVKCGEPFISRKGKVLCNLCDGTLISVKARDRAEAREYYANLSPEKKREYVKRNNEADKRKRRLRGVVL